MEHAVIAHLLLTDAPFGSRRERENITALADQLQQVINDHDVGEFDGDEFGDGRCVLYMYGPNADRLFDVIEPILRENPLTQGGFAIKRYGEAKDLNAVEVKIIL